MCRYYLIIRIIIISVGGRRPWVHPPQNGSLFLGKVKKKIAFDHNKNGSTLDVNHSHDSFRVHTIPPWVPPSDAVNDRGQTTAPPSSPLPPPAPPPTSQSAHIFRTPSSASECMTIAKTASTPPAPGTPAHSTPGRADVASTSSVCTGGSIGTPASWLGWVGLG